MIQALVETEPKPALRDALATAGDRLQDALARDVTGRERDWADEAAQALVQVGRELRRHHAVTQTADGPLAALDHTRPTVLRRWGILCLHYRDLVKRVQRLRDDASGAAQAFQPTSEPHEPTPSPSPGKPVGTVPVFGAIRQQAEEVLADLKRTREAETALLLESVTTDIGVGD